MGKRASRSPGKRNAPGVSHGPGCGLRPSPGYDPSGARVRVAGPIGTGKTWLDCVFRREPARKGSLRALRMKLSKGRRLILDDWAVAPVSDRERQDLP